MTTFAPGTFLPNGRFSFPRSYIDQICFQRLGGTLTEGNGIFSLAAPPPDPSTFVMVIDLQFWAWSSNARTLDHIITQSSYRTGPLSPLLPMPFVFSWGVDPVTLLSTLTFAPFGLYGDPVFFRMHSAPADYWLPRPLR